MSDFQEQQTLSEESEQMSTTSTLPEKSEDQPEETVVPEETKMTEETDETEAAETVYGTLKKPPRNEISWFQQIPRKIEEENLVLSYFNEDDVFRFRIEHNHATRPLVGAVFKTRNGDDLVSLNELTLPLDRFLAMTECWNSPGSRHVVMVCDQNYVLENTTGQQIREAFLFLHKHQVDEDREDDATACAVFSMIIILVGILLALGAYLRFGGDSVRPPSV